MANKDQQQSGRKHPSIGSVLIVFILKIFGGFLGLFHGRKTYSNMNSAQAARHLARALPRVQDGPHGGAA